MNLLSMSLTDVASPNWSIHHPVGVTTFPLMWSISTPSRSSEVGSLYSAVACLYLSLADLQGFREGIRKRVKVGVIWKGSPAGKHDLCLIIQSTFHLGPNYA